MTDSVQTLPRKDRKASQKTLKIQIKEIAYHLPEAILSNSVLQAENPSWDMALVEARSGVFKRHIARENETALDLAVKACERLFSNREEAKERIDAILFCTQSPDYIMPPNACLLHKMLKLPQDVFATDFNLACSGYVYGLALAEGLIASGRAKEVLLVTADTYSKYIHRQDRSARVLFGDGAAASWIAASDAGQGILDIQCATSGEGYEKFMIQAGGCRLPKSKETALPTKDASGNVRTLEHIQMDGMGILIFVNAKVPRQVRELLSRNRLTVEEIDLFVFHQASKMALDSLARLLKIPSEKVYQNLSEVGNTVSASIPIALKDAMDKGKIYRGQKVLLCGFGVGLSWGTALMET